MHKKTIHEILADLIAIEGIRPTELARRTGLVQSSVQRIIKRTTKSPKDDVVKPLADYFGLTPDQLRGYQPLPDRWKSPASIGAQRDAGLIDEHANVLPVATLPRKRTKYPVISWVRAGDWAESPDNFQPGDADDWLESEEKAGPHGYWLVVDGDSMTPLFPQGSRILVQPEGFDLISGKYYVAICYEPGRKRDTTVKQYVRDAGFEYLKPLNPTYRTLEVSEAVRIVGRVIDYKLPPGVL